MRQTIKNTLRSWMFIYAGLVAAIVLACQPVGGGDRSNLDETARSLIADAPLGRADI